MKVMTNFTIDSEIMDKFRALSKREAINMSQFVENKFKEKLEEEDEK